MNYFYFPFFSFILLALVTTTAQGKGKCEEKLGQLNLFSSNVKLLTKSQALLDATESEKIFIVTRPKNTKNFGTPSSSKVKIPKEFRERTPSVLPQIISTDNGYVAFKFIRHERSDWSLLYYDSETGETQELEIKSNLRRAQQNVHTLSYTSTPQYTRYRDWNNLPLEDFGNKSYVKQPQVRFNKPYAYVKDFQTSSTSHSIEVFDLKQNKTYEMNLELDIGIKLGFGAILSSPQSTFYVGYKFDNIRKQIKSVFVFDLKNQSYRDISIPADSQNATFRGAQLNEENIPVVYLSIDKKNEYSSVKSILLK